MRTLNNSKKEQSSKLLLEEFLIVKGSVKELEEYLSTPDLLEQYLIINN